MEEYYFSEKNVGELTKQLILNLELGQDELNKDVVFKCKKIISNQMKNTFDKYGNQKPNTISSKDYIGKMNNSARIEETEIPIHFKILIIIALGVFFMQQNYINY